jgi:cellulose biosynthesis protein BcsQ
MNEIISFYSYKGGTGRSFLLANVAWILASNGKRVLMIDWDLEAPGLHRYFHPFLRDQYLATTPGMMDWVSDYQDAATDLGADFTEVPEKVLTAFADPSPYIVPLDVAEWQLTGFGALHLLPAGQQDDRYADRVNRFNWLQLYQKMGGERFFNQARAEMIRQYDYVLIDSRTGVSDTSGICTLQMPDKLVVCFTLNSQSVIGASSIARSAGAQRAAGASVEFKIFPVPTRIDRSEKLKLEISRQVARKAFDGFPTGFREHEADRYWGQVEVPYESFYGYEEVLAVFGDEPNQVASVLAAAERLSGYLTGLPSTHLDYMNREIRLKILSRYLRQSEAASDPSRDAERIFQQLNESEESNARSLFLRFTFSDPHGQIHITSVPSSKIAEELSNVLERFKNEDVIVQKDGTFLELAEPRLISAWPRLARWAEENIEFIRWRTALKMRIAAWEKTSRKDDFLLTEAEIPTARDWLAEKGSTELADEADFVDKSDAYRNAQKRQREDEKNKADLLATELKQRAAMLRGPSDRLELVIMDEVHEGMDRLRSNRTPRFAQIFASYGGARVTSTIQLHVDGAEQTQFGQIIRMHERIKAYTNREKGSLPDDGEMIVFGVQLFDTLFRGDVRRLYDDVRRNHRGRLDLVLTTMIPWIADKPWELAYDHGRQSFLATDEIHFSRNVMTNVPVDPIVRSDGPLRVLVVSAQPVGFGRLSIDQEVAVIRRGFEPLVEAGMIEIESLARATPAQIHGYLQTGSYQVVHFIGHGVYDDDRGEGALIFVNEQGGEYPLASRSVREIFRGRGLSLVFLNACENGRGGRADFNKGVAQSLVAHGLPALVANQYSVLDSSATLFAQRFYWSLAQGMSLGEAARESRIAVNYSLHGEPIDWAVPVLYARDPYATLCAPPAMPKRVPATSIGLTFRRATAAHGARIAVWDIDSVFPALNRTLVQMNGSQSAFGFELVDLSVPLGVWDLASKRGTPYLWAERLAYRLQRAPMELGVDLLACVTRHWMRDDNWLNIYSWWPESNKPPILICSVAGFEELPPEGPETDRAIANAMVCGLAGFYGDVSFHARGASDCPMAFNEGRDFKYVAGPLKFDANCRKKLQLKLGSKFTALETLLRRPV